MVLLIEIITHKLTLFSHIIPINWGHYLINLVISSCIIHVQLLDLCLGLQFCYKKYVLDEHKMCEYMILMLISSIVKYICYTLGYKLLHKPF